MTTGRQNIEAAFSPGGAAEIPAVLCYEDIFYRDHWEEVTACPWWYAVSPDIEHQLAWRREAFAGIGQDWFRLPACAPRAERAYLTIQARAGGVYLADDRGTQPRRLTRQPVGGEHIRIRGSSQPIETYADIDRAVPLPPPFDADTFRQEGRADLAAGLLGGAGAGLMPLVHVSSPLWLCASLWGFEAFMLALADTPGLVRYACERYALWCERQVAEAAALGAGVVWLEECLTDLISAGDFRAHNLPFMRRLAEAIRCAGMYSIYYYCGSPAGKLEHILDAGADAVAFEESKKGFTIDIEDVVEAVGGRCAVLGNLDATAFLPVCSEAELRAEIGRQMAAGRRNGSRFILSMGSPVTPGTPARKVRLYCDLAHELGER